MLHKVRPASFVEYAMSILKIRKFDYFCWNSQSIFVKLQQEICQLLFDLRTEQFHKNFANYLPFQTLQQCAQKRNLQFGFRVNLSVEMKRWEFPFDLVLCFATGVAVAVPAQRCDNRTCCGDQSNRCYFSLFLAVFIVPAQIALLFLSIVLQHKHNKNAN